jgi:virginiamycin B lyase
VTEGGQNAIARVDPGDHEVTLFRLPEKEAYANLNTAVFDKSGIYWFTGQSGIYGRLDPKSGDMTVFKSPRGRGTYGMTDHAEGRHLVRLARRQSHRQDRSGDRQRDRWSSRRRPIKGARRVWSDSKGPDLGQRMEQRQRVGSRSRRRLVEGMEAAGQQSRAPMRFTSTTRTRSG